MTLPSVPMLFNVRYATLVAHAPQCRSHTFFLSRTPAEGYLFSREML
jgi:hypothetical protein